MAVNAYYNQNLYLADASMRGFLYVLSAIFSSFIIRGRISYDIYFLAG